MARTIYYTAKTELLGKLLNRAVLSSARAPSEKLTEPLQQAAAHGRVLAERLRTDDITNTEPGVTALPAQIVSSPGAGAVPALAEGIHT